MAVSRRRERDDDDPYSWCHPANPAFRPTRLASFLMGTPYAHDRSPLDFPPSAIFHIFKECPITEKRPSKDAKTALRQSVSVEIAAASGDYLTALKAIRDRLAIELDITSSQRDTTVLSNPFADVLSLIEAEERSRRGQSGQSASNDEAAAERVRQSLTQAATFVQQVPDELL
jgi:hypothetical protein